VNKLDLTPLASDFISEQLSEEMPAEMMFLTEYLDDAIAEVGPTIKEELIAGADPILDYLLGQTNSLSIVISLQPVMEGLKDSLRESLLETLPPELADLPQDILEQQFDQYFAEFTKMMPSTFELDESSLGAETPAMIAESLAEAEDGLEEARLGIAEGLATAEDGLKQARVVVGYFQLGYKALIGFMVLLIGFIILINRQVKDTTRGLGTTFLTYGAFEYVGIIVGKYFAEKQFPVAEIPPSFQAWLLQLLDNLLAPLEMFSLGLLIGGLVLIIVSFVYKPR
jgi:hypothetical protein